MLIGSPRPIARTGFVVDRSQNLRGRERDGSLAVPPRRELIRTPTMHVASRFKYILLEVYHIFPLISGLTFDRSPAFFLLSCHVM